MDLKDIKEAVAISNDYTDAGENVSFTVVENDGTKTVGALATVSNNDLVVVDLEDYTEYSIPIQSIKEILEGEME